MSNTISTIESVYKLSKDLKKAAGSMTSDEARYFTDTYYQMQKFRTKTNSQIKAVERGADSDLPEETNPHEVLSWLHDIMYSLENDIKGALGIYAKSDPVGQWCLSQKGIGPVITAGLLAHIDINKAPTAGHIWSFAGLNPNSKWEKGQKRPWNASLKALCAYKMGECFIKVQNRDDAFYGEKYKERKASEWKQNLAGEFAHLAKEKQGVCADTTNAHKWYSGLVDPDWAAEKIKTGTPFGMKVEEGKGSPMLPPDHIKSRARRWTVKLFLSHFHHVLYSHAFKKDPPVPYAIEHLGHTHFIPIPNIPDFANQLQGH